MSNKKVRPEPERVELPDIDATKMNMRNKQAVLGQFNALEIDD